MDAEAELSELAGRFPAARRLLLDCWALMSAPGADPGSVVRAYRRALEAHAGACRELAARGAWAGCPAGPAGAVLGAAPLPPGGGDWWALLPDGRVVPGDDRRAGGAAYWCRGGAGWWRVSP